MLEHEADIALAQAEAGRIDIVEQHAPVVGMQQAADHPQQRGLAGAGRAEQRNQLAGGDVQVDAVQRGHAGIVLGQALQVQLHGSVSPVRICQRVAMTRLQPEFQDQGDQREAGKQ